MAQFNITRLLDTSKAATTQAGQQLSDVLDYLTSFVEETVKNLRSGLTFKDNVACDVKTVQLKHGVAQKVSSTKPATGMLVTRVQDPGYLVDAFNWYYDATGSLTVVCAFKAADLSATLPSSGLNVDLVILF